MVANLTDNYSTIPCLYQAPELTPRRPELIPRRPREAARRLAGAHVRVQATGACPQHTDAATRGPTACHADRLRRPPPEPRRVGAHGTDPRTPRVGSQRLPSYLLRPCRGESAAGDVAGTLGRREKPLDFVQGDHRHEADGSTRGSREPADSVPLRAPQRRQCRCVLPVPLCSAPQRRRAVPSPRCGVPPAGGGGDRCARSQRARSRKRRSERIGTPLGVGIAIVLLGSPQWAARISADMCQPAAAKAAAPGPPSTPTPSKPAATSKPAVPHIAKPLGPNVRMDKLSSLTELPARFRRKPLSEEEMAIIDVSFGTLLSAPTAKIHTCLCVLTR